MRDAPPTHLVPTGRRLLCRPVTVEEHYPGSPIVLLPDRIAMETKQQAEIVAAGPGAFAAAIGKSVHVFAADGARKGEPLPHATTVQGLAFAPNGKRVAASHYNGVSLWWANGEKQQPKVLAWKGSHLSVTFSPDLRFVVTAMQEAALHGWRVADGAHFRMTGYPAKIRRFAWLQKGRWLATSGAGAAILWPFTGRDGPMEKSAKELGWAEDVLGTDLAAKPGGEFYMLVLDVGGFNGAWRAANQNREDRGAENPRPRRHRAHRLALAHQGRVCGMHRCRGARLALERRQTAGVVRVAVRHKNVADIARLAAEPAHGLENRPLARRVSCVDQRQGLIGFDQVRIDHP